MDFVRSRLIPSLRRRLRRHVRVHLGPLISRPPRILHLSLVGTEGQNRGDACMCLAIPRIVHRVCPSVNFTFCRMDEIREHAPITGETGPCDMVILGGGGLYGPWYDLSRYARLKELGVPVILYGLGVNLRHGMNELPETSLRGGRILNEIASLSSVRDVASQRYLNRYGIQTQVIGDPAVFYDPIGKTRGRVAGTLNVGLNLPYHEPSLRGEVDRLCIPAIRQVALDFLKRGARLHYLLHHPSEHAVLRQLEDIPMTVHSCGAPHLIQRYHELDIVICGMLHSAIFAFNAEVPFIVIGYDQKHESFMDLIEAKTRYIPLAEVNYDWLCDMAGRTLAELSRIRNDLASTRSHLWQRHRAFVEAILTLLPGLRR